LNKALNLFSKIDVEDVRTQREAFRRKRAHLGGSQRFGKPAGPKRIYEAGVGVKQKRKKLCLCRQSSLIAGDGCGDADCLLTI
jgi:hypothetical protein